MVINIKRPIGLELGDGMIRMLQLAGAPDAPRLVAARRRPLPAGLTPTTPAYCEAVVDAITATLQEGVFTGRQVVSCVPASAVQYKNLRLPPMPSAEIAEAVRWEAAERLGDTSGTLTIQHFDAGEVRQGEDVRREVIAVAVSEEAIARHVDMLVAAGLRPVCIDVAASALSRLTGRGEPDGSNSLDVEVLLNLRTVCTEVLVVRGARVLFCKTIAVGIHCLEEAIVEQLDVDREQATRLRLGLDEPDLDPAQRAAAAEAMEPALAELGREIGLCLRYYGVTFRGRRPDNAALVGAMAGQSWLAQRIGQGAGVQVQTWNLPERLRLADAAMLGGESSGAWAVALGLAVRPTRSPLTLPWPRKEAA